VRSLEDKVVVITGAASGIGRALAVDVAGRGARVAVSDIDERGLAETVDLVQAAGAREVRSDRLDVADRAAFAAYAETVAEHFGRVDVVVNNAGIGPLSRFDALQVDEWDETIDINVKGVLYGIAAALPVFGKQQSGHVITVVSTAGLRILPKMGVYAASKNAVRTIMEALRQESGPNIRVTEISPGAIQTEFLTTVGDEAEQARLRAWSDRIAIPADSIARAIAFAIDQPADVEIGSIVVRPTAQD